LDLQDKKCEWLRKMQVIVSQKGAVSVVKPMGPVIAGELAELENELLKLTRNWTKRVVINLTDVPFIDSAGLELMLRYQMQLNSHGLKLKLSSLNEMTQKIFDLTQLSKNFEMFPDTSTAVRSFL